MRILFGVIWYLLGGLMIGVSEFKRAANRARLLFQGRLSCYDIALSLVKDKAGLEIGGPSWVFRDWYAPLPIYKAVESLDNCVFSDKTVWATLSNRSEEHTSELQ